MFLSSRARSSALSGCARSASRRRFLKKSNISQEPFSRLWSIRLRERENSEFHRPYRPLTGSTALTGGSPGVPLGASLAAAGGASVPVSLEAAAGVIAAGVIAAGVITAGVITAGAVLLKVLIVGDGSLTAAGWKNVG